MKNFTKDYNIILTKYSNINEPEIRECAKVLYTMLKNWKMDHKNLVAIKKK